jgi:hypothetical protein
MRAREFRLAVRQNASAMRENDGGAGLDERMSGVDSAVGPVYPRCGRACIDRLDDVGTENLNHESHIQRHCEHPYFVPVPA